MRREGVEWGKEYEDLFRMLIFIPTVRCIAWWCKRMLVSGKRFDYELLFNVILE